MRRWRGALGLAVCLPATGGTAATLPVRYAVAPIRSDWADDREVGRRGSGAVCAPAGRLVWREVAPDPARAADRVAQGLRKAGGNVSTIDDVGDGSRLGRIIVRVEALTLRACTPHFGIVRLLGGRMLEGEGQITLAWRLVPPEGMLPVERTITSTFRFRGKDLDLREAVLDVLAENAVRIASYPEAGAAPPASIR